MPYGRKMRDPRTADELFDTLFPKGRKATKRGKTSMKEPTAAQVLSKIASSPRDIKYEKADKLAAKMLGWTPEEISDMRRAKLRARRRELLVRVAAVLTALAAWVALALHFMRA